MTPFGVAANKLTVQILMEKSGLAYNANDPYASLYAAIVSRNEPSCIAGTKFDASWKIICEASLRMRGLLYFKDKPGDVATQTKVSQSGVVAGLKGTSMALGTVTSIGTAAHIGALATTTALGTALGAATLGVGLIALPIMAIFQHHAAAVAQEKQYHAAVSQQANVDIPQIDALVKSGQITPAQGVGAMQKEAAFLKNNLAPVLKGCNEATGYDAILDAHVDFAGILYPAIAPGAAAAGAPGSPTAVSATGGAALPQVMQSIGAHPGWILGFAVIILLLIVAVSR